MVRLDHQTAVRGEPAGYLRQGAGELVQFAVHFDAQCLEHALGGVSSGTVRLRHHLVDEPVELGGRRQRFLRATAHDLAGDLAGEPFLPVCAEYAYQLALGVLGQDALRGQGLADVHAHVERRVVRVGEAAVRLIDLQARQTQIHEHRIHPIDALVVKHLAERVECGVDRYEAVRKSFPGDALGGHGECFRIPVDAQHAGLRRGFEEGDGVAGQTERAVDRDGSGVLQRRGDQRHALLKQYWLVNRSIISHQNPTTGSTSSAMSA